jgi:hypothetical protein
MGKVGEFLENTQANTSISRMGGWQVDSAPSSGCLRSHLYRPGELVA